ncbi:MAG TPA: DMT family transporter [Alphaproteobacteria bacterium]|nr:DMT family transporter [Alphaproteobacteria bacterium]
MQKGRYVGARPASYNDPMTVSSPTAPTADIGAPESGAAARLRATRFALAALFLGGFATSLSGVFIKLSELPPTATGFYRVFLSTPLLFLWLRWERPRLDPLTQPKSWRDRRDLVVAGVLFGVNTTCWCWCMRYTSVANGQLITNISPIFVSLGAFIFLRERFGRVFLVGMGLTLAGVGMLMGKSITLGGEGIVGDLLAVASAFFWSCYLIATQNLRRRFSTATLMTWTAAISALLLLAVSKIVGDPLVPLTFKGWAALFGLAFVSQVTGQGLVTYAFSGLPASFIAIGLLIQPIYAMIVAWPVLGEAPTPIQIVAAGTVLTGIVLARRGSK